ncbi:SixA phosphatase family protein [Agromyces mangrovi Wang et al. 2018]|uniref:SixA phosphatase family protein n=1 Tax=Agromyces mangrovi TaxID=1858653 RepID=UPI002573F93B|nr:histidine phosphatase family protein [Agromyces mangrovi]BDZ64247.1 phosphohistidine phosphatase [Agromyces mangrovi]
MKTLILVRHAKSDWGDARLDDHERPLNERGQRDAPEMGRRLAERGVVPDAIRSSTAVRARTTAAALAEALGLGAERLVLEERLYGASAATLRLVAEEFDESVGTGMIVAHDPGMSDLAYALSGSIGRMPTCAVAEFDFDVTHWAETVAAIPVDVRLDTPKG